MRLLVFALVMVATNEVFAQYPMPAGTRQWVYANGNEANAGTCCDDYIGGVGTIPYPSADYANAGVGSTVVFVNGDTTANRMRIAYWNRHAFNVFAYASMLDTYTISGSPGSEVAPVQARLVMRTTGTLFVGETQTSGLHFGSSTVIVEVGTWSPATTDDFSEQFRVSAFDPSFTTFAQVPSANYGTTTPTLEADLVIDQVITRNAGEPFDVAFGIHAGGNGAGNIRGVNSPAPHEYIIGTIDWELPEGYTLTSVLGWTDPDGESPFCRADFNGDGDIGTDQDIEAFFACLGGACCQGCGSPDFNGDGDVGTDGDIESFFRVLGGGTC